MFPVASPFRLRVSHYFSPLTSVAATAQSACAARTRCPSKRAKPDQFGLRPLKISVNLTALRLPQLAPQVSQVGNAALIEREGATLSLDHAFGFELADVGPAAIEVQR